MNAGKRSIVRKFGFVSIAILLVIYPLVLPRFYSALATEILIMGLYALSFNLMFGYAGMLSFGQAVFFGVGAYITALVLKHIAVSLTLAMLSCFVFTLLTSVLIGYVCVRFTKTYFIMLTVAFGELIYVIGHKCSKFTGGDDGLVGIPIPTIRVPGLPPADLQDLQTYYYFVLIIVGVATFALRIITNSHFGYVLRAIRESPERAAFLGIDVRRHRLLCYAIAGAFAGLAGALLVLFEGMVSLETLHFSKSGDPIIMSILGGTRLFLGPFVGAALFILIKDMIQNFTEFWMIGMGIIFVATVMFLPGGVAGFFSSLGLFRSRTPTTGKKEE